MVKVARVTMKDGIRPYDERNPLTAPRRMLMTRTTAVAEGTDIPSNLIREAMIMVSSAMAAPGERSIPPVRMTSVEPTARIASMLACSATLLRLSRPMNRSVDNATAVETIIREMIGPITGRRERNDLLGLIKPSFGGLAGWGLRPKEP